MLLLGASWGSLGVSDPYAQSRLDPLAQADAAPQPSPGRGQAIGADGDTPPNADPPSETGTVTPVAPAGEQRVVTLPGTGSVNGVPVSVLAAYRHAAAVLSRSMPGCHLPTTLLAAIGKVESGHARGGRVDSTGTTRQAILGPVLNGSAGTAAIRDTDGGRYDGNTTWDRAVGPMQFIPSTWRRWATDGNADGLANPHNVFDASVTSGRYLCANGRDLDTPADLESAIFSYNHSNAYVRLVLAWMRAYENGTVPVPDGTGPLGRSNSDGRDQDGNPQAAPAPGGPGGGTDRPGSGPDQPGGPWTPGDPGQPGGPGGPSGPGQPGGPGGDPSDPGGPGDPGSPGQPGDPDDPGQPSDPDDPPGPDPTQPPPAAPDPLTGVVCAVQGIIGVGTGLIGGLIGAPPPPPPPECTPTTPPPPPPP